MTVLAFIIYSGECKTIDTNQVSPVWEDMDPMPIARGHFPFVSLNKALYAIAGYPCTDRVDRWRPAEGWDTVANFPEVVSINKR